VRQHAVDQSQDLDKLFENRLSKENAYPDHGFRGAGLRGRGFTRTCPLRTWDSETVRKDAASMRITSMPGRHGPILFSSHAA
jgi:hypothetical protein